MVTKRCSSFRRRTMQKRLYVLSVTKFETRKKVIRMSATDMHGGVITSFFRQEIVGPTLY